MTYTPKNVRKAVSAGTDRETAILNAMDRIVAEEQGLSDFFKKHRAEVTDVFLKEYNEDEVHQVFREDGYNEGLEEGRLSQLVDLVRDGTLDISIASSKAGLSVDQFQALLTQ